jgi:hypothetical protein
VSWGRFGQRDILGAVDFMRSGSLPYPDPGRPKNIGGFGESMGAATLLLAAAHEPALQIIVSDTAYARNGPELEHELPRHMPLPAFFTPGVLLTYQALYGIDLYAERLIDIVDQIAPGPS